MNDGIDTLRDNNDIAPFKNILNEMYLSLIHISHVLLTMRAMDEHGKWLPKSRKVYDLDENGERIKLPCSSIALIVSRTWAWGCLLYTSRCV